MSKMGKELKESLKEAIKETKESKAPEYSADGRKNWFFCGDKGWPTVQEMMADWEKERREKWNKMTPEQKKKEKEKEKARIAKKKAEDKKRDEKYAKQRAKDGFCDVDVWSYDYWLLGTSIKILNKLLDNKHGWQPLLGYKIVNKKLVKTKKGEEITAKQEKEVIKYMIANMQKMLDYLNMDDLDFKKNYDRKFYLERDKKINAIKKETFNLLGDILFALWD